MTLAWGQHVSETFRERVAWIGEQLGLDPSDLMACMAFESAETFSASVRNAAGSGAIGLIQFMPQTAALLGTTTEMLGQMKAEDQLNYVYKYFVPMKGRLRDLGDIYMAILWPAGIGKPDTWVMFTKAGYRPQLYLQNRGLDLNQDGDVTRGEALTKVKAERAKGLLPENAA